MINKSDRWALITGASSGIGYEMAKILAGRDLNLILVSRNEEKLCQIAGELNKVSHVIVMPLDLSTTGSGKIVFDECERLGLSVEILINNAGFGKFGESTDLPPETIESMLTLNMVTLTTLSSLFGNKMKERGHGHILNIASTAGFQPLPYFSAYSASKRYVQHFSKSLRSELKRYGVKVTCISPGATRTNFLNVALDGTDERYFKYQRFMSAERVAKISLKAMFKGRKAVIAGKTNRVMMALSPFMPTYYVEKLLRKNL
jgi:short-subunit dehydrogenase